MNDVILTGVDGSETAAKAAKIAASLASDLKCDLYVLSAYASSDSLPGIGQLSSASAAEEAFAEHRAAEEAAAASAKDIAETVAEQLRQEFSDISVTALGIEGNPADVIVEQAEKLDARMVVVGNKHVQGFSRILGSVAAAVARRIQTDLYVANTR